MSEIMYTFARLYLENNIIRKNGINNENKDYGSGAVGCGADSERAEKGGLFGKGLLGHWSQGACCNLHE